jgi:lysophospholipase L1-like esterase
VISDQIKPAKVCLRFAAALAAVWAYLSAVFLFEERVASIKLGLGLWIVLIPVAMLLGELVARWAMKRNYLSARLLDNMTALCLSAVVSLIVLDISYSAYLNSSRTNFDYATARVFDKNIWTGELYPRLHYPTERNFALHKPGVQVAGSPYGNFYSPPMLDSPTLLDSVLARQPVNIQINSLGFRESSDIGGARIFALGDSFTFGWGVDATDSWPEILGREISQEVYNLGIHDASPRQELELLKYVLDKYATGVRPEKLVWMIYEGNDLEDDYSEVVYPYQGPTEVPLFAGTVIEAAESLVRTIRTQSIIYRVQRDQIRLRKADRGPGDNPFQVDGVNLVYPLYRSETLGPRLFYQYYVELAGMPVSYVDTHWNRAGLEQVFEEMRTLAASQGFEVAVVFAPSAARLHGPYFDEFPPISKRPHFLEFVESLSAASGFSFVNLYTLMKPYAQTELLYFRDDDHFNQRGNALAADLIARQLFRTDD